MTKWISIAVSAVIGAALAVIAAWGVVSSSTAAPNSNPADQQIVQYGSR